MIILCCEHEMCVFRSTWCGVYLTGNRMTIVFITDQSGSGSGFNAEFTNIHKSEETSTSTTPAFYSAVTQLYMNSKTTLEKQFPNENHDDHDFSYLWDGW